MSFPSLNSTCSLSENDGPTAKTDGQQSSSISRHMASKEQDSSHMESIPANEALIAIDDNNRNSWRPIDLDEREVLTQETDLSQGHLGSGGQSQSAWDDIPINKTGWGPEFYTEADIPGSPTEVNSPTRYEEFISTPQPQSTRECPSRARIPARKAQEIKNTDIKNGAQKNPEVGSTPEVNSSPAPTQNKFLDDDGDLLFPSIQQMWEMTESDNEEWRRAKMT
ncbi:hypothetical protein FALBO_10525 [Fusarium albosuccineum]|uniref:Uncharacterized protein n=1 Tax=Fusarium albosuccineum TaxID=1237068 RepID=A0A8H4L6T4_9HYPO|nr:hypothetical protein FALBO_10525 [Fusarium albosuccineum]